MHRDGFCYDPQEFPELHQWLREQAARGSKSAAIRDVLHAHVTGTPATAPAHDLESLVTQLLHLLQQQQPATAQAAVLNLDIPAHLRNFGL